MRLQEQIVCCAGVLTTGPHRGFFRLYETVTDIAFGYRQVNTREYPRLMKLRGLQITDYFPVNTYHEEKTS